MEILTTLSPLTLIVLMLSLASIIGLWIGQFKIGGVSLGIGGVLFGGILVGHFLMSQNIHLLGCKLVRVFSLL